MNRFLALRMSSLLMWQSYVASAGEHNVMSVRMKNWTTTLLFLATTCIAGPGRHAEGQLRWSYPPKKAPIRLRLVAIAYADHPRSSYFSSQEVFVAETQVTA